MGAVAPLRCIHGDHPFARMAPVLALTAALSLAGARPASAQETGLSKSQLVSLVVSSASAAEKLETVRTQCLSFEPTERDWRDLRNLGAEEDLIAAGEECAREAQALRVALNASRFSVPAGDTTLLTVDLTRAGTPVAGHALVLSGSGGAGAGVRLSRTTDARGRAFFSLAAGETVGSARYVVSAPGFSLDGSTRVTLTTVADVPSAVTVNPPSIDLAADQEPPEVGITVRDRFGNPVPGLDLVLIASSDTDSVLATATTESNGKATFTVADVPPGDVEAWEIRSEAAVLASLPVRIERPSPAAAGAVAAGVAVGADAAAPGIGPADETPIDATIREGYEYLEEGDAVAAEQSFRAALGINPRRPDAQKGLAAAFLAQDRADEAVVWYEVATRRSPGDADAWYGLGQAYSAAGRRNEAADALSRAQEIDPTLAEVDTEIADLGRPPGYVTGSLWGGSTFDNSESGGIRRAAFDLSFSPAVKLWGGWDRSLAPRSPELVRGPDEWDSWFAGGSLSYGSGHRLETAFSLGQRTQKFGPVDETSSLKQNVYRLTQIVRFSDAPLATELRIGGYLGRWFDREDWIVFSRFKTPIGRQLSFVASGSYGETIGTNWIETGRHADKDGRLYAGVAWENGKGLVIQPVLGVGSVSSEQSDDLSGTLFDLLLEAAVPITRGSEFRGYVRHQRPPGGEAFTVVALALGFKMGWAGG